MGNTAAAAVFRYGPGFCSLGPGGGWGLAEPPPPLRGPPRGGGIHFLSTKIVEKGAIFRIFAIFGAGGQGCGVQCDFRHFS